MTYFVFIETGTGSVPHMEALDADNPSSATLEALSLLRRHTSGVVAHVYEGEARIASLQRDAVIA